MNTPAHVYFVLAVFISISAGALTPKTSKVSNEKTAYDRTCILQLSQNQGPNEYLSGVLINNTRMLTVGHSDNFNENIAINCGISGRKAIKIDYRARHPLYDYRGDPHSVSEWAKYDIAIIDINPSLTIGVPPIQIISDIAEIRSLISQGRCIYGGSGAHKGDITKLKTTFVETPTLTNLVSETHATVIHPGDPEVIHGDSGGPLLCRRADNIYYLAGLIDYSGTIKDHQTGKTQNIVAVLVLRPELVNWFSK